MVAQGDSLLSHPAATTDYFHRHWDTIDAEFRSILYLTSACLASDDISPTEAGDTFVSLFRAHLERYDILKQSDNSKVTEVVRRSRRMEKVTERLRRLKNTQKKMWRRDRPSFNNVFRAHNKAKRLCDQLATDSRLRYHERAFRSNVWHYAKKVCTDSSNTPCLDCSPDSAFAYFAENSRDDGGYSALPSWVANVQHVPSDEDLLELDLSPITPSLIKQVLKKRPSVSAPGVDGITYHHLKMMSSTHHFLATLFSKIFLHSQVPPTSWIHAKIIMVHKNGDPTIPANFRPVALT